MIPNTEILKMPSENLLELINEFGKVTEYKVNAQKPLALSYTGSKRSETEIKETIPFTTACPIVLRPKWRPPPARRKSSFPGRASVPHANSPASQSSRQDYIEGFHSSLRKFLEGPSVEETIIG